jgi:hypothetical protein
VWWVLGGLAAVIGVVFAAVVIVAVVKHQIPKLAVGQCVSSDDYAALILRPADCANIDAVYQFAGEAQQGKCPDGERVEDGVYFYLEKANTEQLCFALNLRQGECYLMDLSEKTMAHEACAGAPARASSTTGAIKVRERIDGEVDESRCPTDTTPLAYSEPARLYCLEKATGGPLSTF